MMPILSEIPKMGMRHKIGQRAQMGISRVSTINTILLDVSTNQFSRKPSQNLTKCATKHEKPETTQTDALHRPCDLSNEFI